MKEFTNMLNFNLTTDFYKYLFDNYLKLCCPSNTTICFAPLLKWDDCREYVLAALEYSFVFLHAISIIVIGYIVFGTICYLFCHKRSYFERKRVLLVIARPGDECMFFGPTIVRLREWCDIRVLCLTKGGLQRKRELMDSLEALGICMDRIILMNVSNMSSDHLEWTARRLSRIILHQIESLMINEVYSFDIGGVDGNLDHVSIYYGLASMCLTNKIPRYCKVFTLESVNIIRKYSSFMDVGLSFLMNKQVFVVDFSEQRSIWDAVKKHQTQMTWYRHLYYLYCRYMIVNTYKQLDQDDVQLVLQMADFNLHLN